ncbi:hypothetical protein AB0B51_30270 [Streptomyces griseus]|uniref:effector-associated constant component EACC1 n=1 Tax=Streptomyces griseus TaxID=1911 RepID=UPI0033E3D4C3
MAGRSGDQHRGVFGYPPRRCPQPADQVLRRPGAGELGAAEVIQLLVPSSAVLAVAIRTLPAFIKSRRSSVTVKLTREDRTVTISGGNLDDPQKVLEIVERLLGDDERARDERALDE